MFWTHVHTYINIHWHIQMLMANLWITFQCNVSLICQCRPILLFNLLCILIGNVLIKCLWIVSCSWANCSYLEKENNLNYCFHLVLLCVHSVTNIFDVLAIVILVSQSMESVNVLFCLSVGINLVYRSNVNLEIKVQIPYFKTNEFNLVNVKLTGILTTIIGDYSW